MRTQTQGNTLIVSDFTELTTNDGMRRREYIRQSLTDAHTILDVDLSQVRFLDSHGISVLISLHKTMCQRGGKMRLLHPQPAVFQILQLLSLGEVFEIINP
jgi:anti-anti-sigma factor